MSIFEAVFIFFASLLSVLACTFVFRWFLELFYDGAHSEKIVFAVVPVLLIISFVDWPFADFRDAAVLAGLAAGLVVTWLMWFRPLHRSGVN